MRRRIDAKPYETLDGQKPSYCFDFYERLFDPFSDRDIRLLELGVYKGGSLLVWRDYFEKGTIAGLDIDPVQIKDDSGRIRVYQGRQEDTRMLDRIAGEQAPEGFDIIIDDCSHVGRLTSVSFWHLFARHLKPGGLYIIEDVGTSYLDHWPDGCHYEPISLPTAYSPLAAAQGVQRQARISLVSRIARQAPQLTGFLSRSKRIKAIYRATDFSKYGKRVKSHTYGMVGFAKQLVDLCLLGPEIKGNCISEMHFFRNMLVVVRSADDG